MRVIKTIQSAIPPGPSALAAGACAVVLALTGAAAAHAAPTAHGNGGGSGGGVQLEDLDRGLVAVPTGDGVLLSWRLLGHETAAATPSGLKSQAFRVYRDGRRIATVTGSTNHLDTAGSAGDEYRVAPAGGGHGKGGGAGATAEVWSESHHELPLRKPEGGVTPDGEEYGYTANDMSVGDVTGDGRYEYVVKWTPTNAKDVSQTGYTGNTYIDTYTRGGTLLHRIDLGVNIRSGAHYTQFLVYDFDGDGRSELMFKTAPGTRTIGYGSGGEPEPAEYITLPADDAAAGVSNGDDYRMSSADYYEHLVKMFRGWHEHPEVRAGNWPATLEEAFGIEYAYDYPLSRTDAEALADHFTDTYAPGRSSRNDLRNFEGFVLSGPEYLTVFDGRTGAELDTVDYAPARGDDGLMWGDYAMSRIEPGNRVDRFLSGVAYLDGTRPSAVFARGYYTRAALAAYRWDGRQLTRQWLADSGHAPMSNPFNDSPHGVEGADPEHGTLTSQGNHQMTSADVDGDGKQEIVYGAATIDDDGSLLYSSYATGHPDSQVPGERVKLGHGDALHVGDLDPRRDGMEIWGVHEGGAYAPYGFAMRDAATGEVLFGGYTGTDTGRGMAGDIDPDIPGLEAWSSMPPDQEADAGLWSAGGEHLGRDVPGTNMSIRWAPDMTTQLVNSGEAPTVDDPRRGTLLTAGGTATNNGTKGNPALVADVFGDWREELLLRTADSEAIRIYTATEVTDRKLYTLMHDPQYRAGIAGQQTAYNQPAYPGFYLASDTDWRQVPVPEAAYPGR
ncbi:hypothetical protein GCM10027570_55950 [Streptomonospora sediminis]